MANLEKLDGYLSLATSGNTNPIPLNGVYCGSISLFVETTDAVGEIQFELADSPNNTWLGQYFSSPPDNVWDRYHYKDENDTLYDGYDISSESCHPRFDFDAMGASFLRIKYVRSSGTGGMAWRVTKKRV